MPSKKRHKRAISKSPPPPLGPIGGGGLVFGFLASIFVLRPPKIFWEGFWVMLGSWPDFLVVCLFSPEKWVGSK